MVVLKDETDRVDESDACSKDTKSHVSSTTCRASCRDLIPFRHQSISTDVGDQVGLTAGAVVHPEGVGCGPRSSLLFFLAAGFVHEDISTAKTFLHWNFVGVQS